METEVKSRKFCDTNDCITIEFLLKREGCQSSESHIPIIRKLITIGRSPNCTITLDSIRVSRMQCEIIYKDGNIFLKDTQSSNGTFVNNERISNEFCKLNIGDYIGFGINPFPKRQYHPSQYVFSLQKYRFDEKSVEIIDQDNTDSQEDHNYYFDPVNNLTMESDSDGDCTLSYDFSFDKEDSGGSKKAKNDKLNFCYDNLKVNQLMSLFDEDSHLSYGKFESKKCQNLLRNGKDAVVVDSNEIIKSGLRNKEKCPTLRHLSFHEQLELDDKTILVSSSKKSAKKSRKAQEISKSTPSSSQTNLNDKTTPKNTIEKSYPLETTLNPRKPQLANKQSLQIEDLGQIKEKLAKAFEKIKKKMNFSEKRECDEEIEWELSNLFEVIDEKGRTLDIQNPEISSSFEETESPNLIDELRNPNLNKTIAKTKKSRLNYKTVKTELSSADKNNKKSLKKVQTITEKLLTAHEISKYPKLNKFSIKIHKLSQSDIEQLSMGTSMNRNNVQVRHAQHLRTNMTETKEKRNEMCLAQTISEIYELIEIERKKLLEKVIENDNLEGSKEEDRNFREIGSNYNEMDHQSQLIGPGSVCTYPSTSNSQKLIAKVGSHFEIRRNPSVNESIDQRGSTSNLTKNTAPVQNAPNLTKSTDPVQTTSHQTKNTDPVQTTPSLTKNTADNSVNSSLVDSQQFFCELFEITGQNSRFPVSTDQDCSSYNLDKKFTIPLKRLSSKEIRLATHSIKSFWKFQSKRKRIKKRKIEEKQIKKKKSKGFSEDKSSIDKKLGRMRLPQVKLSRNKKKLSKKLKNISLKQLLNIENTVQSQAPPNSSDENKIASNDDESFNKNKVESSKQSSRHLDTISNINSNLEKPVRHKKLLLNPASLQKFQKNSKTEKSSKIELELSESSDDDDDDDPEYSPAPSKKSRPSVSRSSTRPHRNFLTNLRNSQQGDQQVYIYDSDEEAVNENEHYSDVDDKRILDMMLVSTENLIESKKSILRKKEKFRDPSRKVSFCSSVFVRTFLKDQS